jgi:hypothetical protein
VNNPESDFERAVKHHPDWKSLWARTKEEADEAHIEPEMLVEAYNEAWNAGSQAGEQRARREADEANYTGRGFSG